MGWKPATQTALDSYETERRSVAARVLGVSTHLLDKYARGHEDAYKRGEESFGLDITYRAPDATGALVAGDRALDAPVLDADGKACACSTSSAAPISPASHSAGPSPTRNTPTPYSGPSPGSPARSGRPPGDTSSTPRATRSAPGRPAPVTPSSYARTVT